MTGHNAIWNLNEHYICPGCGHIISGAEMHLFTNGSNTQWRCPICFYNLHLQHVKEFPSIEQILSMPYIEAQDMGTGYQNVNPFLIIQGIIGFWEKYER